MLTAWLRPPPILLRVSDPPKSGIQTVTDRYIDQSIFAGQRHRRFRAILGQRKQACSRTTAHDDGERSVLEGRFIHS
jgi:hypothetical protein